jgi:hypothetical protein
MTPCILEGSYRYVRGTCHYRIVRRTITWTINLPYHTEVEVSPHTSGNWYKTTQHYIPEGNYFYRVSGRKWRRFVSSAHTDLLPSQTPVCLFKGKMEAKIMLKMSSIILSVLIKIALRTVTNCNRELRTYFWTDFSYRLNSLSEQTSAVSGTAFLNRLQQSLEQPFWTDFSSLLNSLSEQNSAVS